MAFEEITFVFQTYSYHSLCTVFAQHATFNQFLSCLFRFYFRNIYIEANKFCIFLFFSLFFSFILIYFYSMSSPIIVCTSAPHSLQLLSLSFFSCICFSPFIIHKLDYQQIVMFISTYDDKCQKSNVDTQRQKERRQVRSTCFFSFHFSYCHYYY